MKATLFFLFALLLWSCGQQPNTVNTAFYYWSTHYNITGADSVFLHKAGCKKMYVRFFDVGLADVWESTGDVIPKGRLINKQAFLPNTETVPVIFIENNTFSTLNDSARLEWLSSKITTKFFRMARNNGLPADKIKEIQLDCDWTERTRDSYFTFLKIFKRQCPQQKISVTLRLHQYKYRRQAGIPPVDRCMLMYYNMSQITEAKNRNYILDNAEGKKYIKGVEHYTLPLDFALPIYSQQVNFSKPDTAFYGLAQMRCSDTAGQKISGRNDAAGILWLDHEYEFARFEYVTPANLMQAAGILQEAINTDTFSVSFFCLDQDFYQNIGYENIQAVTGRFAHRH